jgi:hypothetical protein
MAVMDVVDRFASTKTLQSLKALSPIMTTDEGTLIL